MPSHLSMRLGKISELIRQDLSGNSIQEHEQDFFQWRLRSEESEFKKNFKSLAEQFSMEQIFQNVLCYPLARKKQCNYNFGNKKHKHFADKSEKGIGLFIHSRSMNDVNIHMLTFSRPHVPKEAWSNYNVAWSNIIQNRLPKIQLRKLGCCDF